MERQDKTNQEKVRLNKSPERNTFQKGNYVKRCLEEGKEPSQDYIRMYEQWDIDKAEREEDPEWAENNMEYDLRSNQWICDKAKESHVYAQNLYAAMCNNDFQKNEFMPRLAGKTWSCSWRYAGGIIADMRQEGDYIDWYCSGIRNHGFDDEIDINNLTEEEQIRRKEFDAYVGESVVTDEIRTDLKKLGWYVCDQSDDTNI
jgi:hypothetical protein